MKGNMFQRSRDFTTLHLIAERRDRVNMEMFGTGVDKLTLMMDLEAGFKACPDMDLQTLLSFPVPDFIHDVDGIRTHLNRRTGELEGCFLPRCASRLKEEWLHQILNDEEAE